MTQRIQLSRGQWAVVDDEDFEWLSQWRWSASEKRKGMGEFYAVRVDKDTKKMVLMHRQIMRPPPNKVVDHINGDGLDNRRSNMRVGTQAQNMANRQRNYNRATSPYRGVYHHPASGKWMATVGQRSGYIGLFRCATAAALAYDRAAYEKYGEFARLNLGGSSVQSL